MKMPNTRSKRWIARAFLLAFTVFAGAAMIVPDADAARRMGGGKSFGRQAQPPMQRDAVNPPAKQPAQAAPSQQGAQAPAAPAAGNRWLGPIAGIAAGLGLAALLSHLGLVGPLAELLASALLIGLLVLAGVFVWRMLRGGNARPVQRRMEPAYHGAGAASGGSQPAARTPAAFPPAAAGAARPGSVAAALGGAGSTEVVHGAARPGNVPADFDAQSFLRNAKVHFYRLQASWDRRDLEDLSEFTTPEVFAELRTQLSEQAGGAALNEVVTLEAELLGIDEGLSDWLASVRFNGAIREDGAQAAEPFQEIWNLSKRKDGRTGWLLAGIQQVH
jgi:predicted lipid-binding transport protein (Tim44 family)